MINNHDQINCLFAMDVFCTGTWWGLCIFYETTWNFNHYETRSQYTDAGINEYCNTVINQKCLCVKIFALWREPMGDKRPGGTQLLLGGCVPHGFPKVVSKERILKNGGSWKRNLENLYLGSWKFGQNKAENANFSKNWKWGHMSGALMVNW